MFPRIAVLGTVGWIMAVLLASVFLGGATKPNFLFQSGVAGIVLAFYCLTLPHTPPKGKAAAGGDVFGLGALESAEGEFAADLYRCACSSSAWSPADTSSRCRCRCSSSAAIRRRWP